jgi:hypothetical protein
MYGLHTWSAPLTHEPLPLHLSCACAVPLVHDAPTPQLVVDDALDVPQW